jgi:hypothetical protein
MKITNEVLYTEIMNIKEHVTELKEQIKCIEDLKIRITAIETTDKVRTGIIAVITSLIVGLIIKIW